MSLEGGGRADKYGNQYENRYLARLLLRLVNELFVMIFHQNKKIEYAVKRHLLLIRKSIMN